MPKFSSLAWGLGTILIANGLTLGCGDGKKDSTDGGKDSSVGKDAAQGLGGSAEAGGSTSAGGPTGGACMGDCRGLGGSGGATSTGGSGDADAGTSTVPACGAFNACGGSIVGTWKLPGKVICGSAGSGATTPSNCPSSVSWADEHQSGTLSFFDDGTYASSVRFQGTETLTYPASCLGSTTCAGLTALTPVDAGVAGSCISDNAGGCVCSYIMDTSTNGQGNYTTSGGRLSVTGNNPAAMDYCVQGNILSMFAVNSISGDQATQEYERQ